MKTNVAVLFTVLVYSIKITFVSASDGDRSPFYQNCVKKCLNMNCTLDGEAFTVLAATQLDAWTRALWGCRDDCRYHCMWRTVAAFHERGYHTPKFHGKWPFLRVLGLQEPCSVLASFLNLASHVYMWTEAATRFRIKDTPLVLFWHLFAAVCVHAWAWSIIFHSRDTPFTEFMDYACALSMVMGLFVAALVRMLHRRRRLCGAALAALLVYYTQHARYLRAGAVDYDYNMAVNVFFGAAGSLAWLGWAGAQWAAGRRYAWRLAAFTLASGAALALELLDFPPRRGWDAHALWHLATAPLPLLFYRFVIDDLQYLSSSDSLSRLTKIQ